MNWVALTTEIYCLRVLETRGLRSMCEQSCFLPKATRENPFCTFVLDPGGLTVSLQCFLTYWWCITWNSPLSSQAVLPVCVSVSRLLSSCDTSHIGLGPAQCQCDFILTTFAMTKNKDFIMWISEAYTSTCNKWVLRIGKALFSALPLHPPHLWWLCTIIWCAFTRNCLVSNLNSF